MHSQGVAGVLPFCLESTEANGIVASLHSSANVLLLHVSDNGAACASKQTTNKEQHKAAPHVY